MLILFEALRRHFICKRFNCRSPRSDVDEVDYLFFPDEVEYGEKERNVSFILRVYLSGQGFIHVGVQTFHHYVASVIVVVVVVVVVIIVAVVVIVVLMVSVVETFEGRCCC